MKPHRNVWFFCLVTSNEKGFMVMRKMIDEVNCFIHALTVKWFCIAAYWSVDFTFFLLKDLRVSLSFCIILIRILEIGLISKKIQTIHPTDNLTKHLIYKVRVTISL